MEEFLEKKLKVAMNKRKRSKDRQDVKLMQHADSLLTVSACCLLLRISFKDG